MIKKEQLPNKQITEKNSVIRRQIESIWLEAYETGEVIFNFSEYPEERKDEQAHLLFRKLRNFQTVLRRNPLKRVNIYNKVQCCRLKKPKNGVIRIIRIDQIAQQSPINNAIAQNRLPKQGKTENSTGIANKMRERFKNSLQKELDSV